MKFLVTATSAAGHINPLLAIARVLVEEGHEVLALTAEAFKDRFIKSGVQHKAFTGKPNRDLSRIFEYFPERADLAPGAEMLLFDMKKVFIDIIPEQYQQLTQTLREFPADVVICDQLFLGSFPLLDRPREQRPAVVHCAISILWSARDDHAPMGPGLPPAQTDEQVSAYKQILDGLQESFYEPVARSLNEVLASVGAAPVAQTLFDATVYRPDLYIQATVPEFEYPRATLPETVRFVGHLPGSVQTRLPEWARDIDPAKKVVLVTQGTVANFDLGQLVGPTLTALNGRDDLVVLVTTGGKPATAIPAPIPANAYVTEFLPYELIMPFVDVLVTNGGYGTVNHALSEGVPIVVAGLTEDKAEIAARVQWSGCGIDLKSNAPDPASLREAIDEVLQTSDYSEAAKTLKSRYAAFDTKAEIIGLLTTVQ
ncbi:glycosyltransferase [Paraburkholderia sp. J76]|uniref:glycosyltransferase n=1 Tax=Paraburkholderia sp. J76 TaxID=2805439 RepID=UPI002ABD44FB|nr:glycosyltransferase [Paraburkholderia sp. J76]